MHQPFHPLYVDYCIYFNGNQDYFECHEVLEEYWKEIAPGDKKHSLVGLIQVATGLYHWRRENYIGANRILQKALDNIKNNQNSPFLAPLNSIELQEQLEKSIKLTASHQPFQPFSLNIRDAQLANQVQQSIQHQPKEDMTFLLHKHKLRDRSDILLARAQKRRSRH